MLFTVSVLSQFAVSCSLVIFCCTIFVSCQLAVCLAGWLSLQLLLLYSFCCTSWLTRAAYDFSVVPRLISVCLMLFMFILCSFWDHVVGHALWTHRIASGSILAQVKAYWLLYMALTLSDRFKIVMADHWLAYGPRPLNLEVIFFILDDRQLVERGAPVWFEWCVHNWYTRHLMNDAGCGSCRHDGRNRSAQRVLEYFLSTNIEFRSRFVQYIAEFLRELIHNAARMQDYAGDATDGSERSVPDGNNKRGILNFRCTHGRHRSLGWAVIAMLIFFLLGVRVKLQLPSERLCRIHYNNQSCHYCKKPAREFSDSLSRH